MEKNTTDVLRTEEIRNSALFSVLKGGKNARLISLASEAPILIRNDSLTSSEHRTIYCL